MSRVTTLSTLLCLLADGAQAGFTFLEGDRLQEARVGVLSGGVKSTGASDSDPMGLVELSTELDGNTSAGSFLFDREGDEIGLQVTGQGYAINNSSASLQARLSFEVTDPVRYSIESSATAVGSSTGVWSINQEVHRLTDAGELDGAVFARSVVDGDPGELRFSRDSHLTAGRYLFLVSFQSIATRSDSVAELLDYSADVSITIDTTVPEPATGLLCLFTLAAVRRR
jgi:hypothetical protein